MLFRKPKIHSFLCLFHDVLPLLRTVIYRFKSTGAEHEYFLSGDLKTLKEGRLLARFLVSRDVLINSSEYFKVMLRRDSPYCEAGQTSVDMEEEHDVSLELWLRQFHDSVDGESRCVELVDVWHAIQLTQKYLFEIEQLKDWFDSWIFTAGGLDLMQFNKVELQSLLFPCHEFGHAEGFAHATKTLAYETDGHILEINPTEYRHLRLRPRIMENLNYARKNLNHQISRRLYINERFLYSTCKCRKDGLFAYELALHKTGAWPSELKFHGLNAISIQKVLEFLKTFRYIAPNKTCALCSSDFKGSVINRCIEHVKKNFDGLCLDCIDDPVKRDWDQDNDAQHDRRNRRYDLACKINHGQPTWWWSYACRKEKPTWWELEKEKKRRQRVMDALK